MSMFQAPLEDMLPFLYFVLGIGAICLLILARNHPRVKPLLTPIFRKRSVGGWILFLLAVLFWISDRWDSIISVLDKLKNMGPVLKFLADGAQSPLVQLVVFVAGVIWIVLAASSAAKSSESKKNNGLREPVRPVGESDWHRLAGKIEESAALAANLSEAQLHRFETRCSSDVDGCVVMANWTESSGKILPVKFFRVEVSTEGKSAIKNCTGFLRRIEKDGQMKWGGDNAKLTFALGEDADALAKTVRHQVPEFLDILVVTTSNYICPATKGRAWPYSPRIDRIFSEIGDYILTVAITGDDVPTKTILLKFSWTGNWQTTTLTLLATGAVSNAQRYTPPKFTGVEKVPPPVDRRGTVS
jgi:hypothetical protein